MARNCLNSGCVRSASGEIIRLVVNGSGSRSVRVPPIIIIPGVNLDASDMGGSDMPIDSSLS